MRSKRHTRRPLCQITQNLLSLIRNSRWSYIVDVDYCHKNTEHTANITDECSPIRTVTVSSDAGRAAQVGNSARTTGTSLLQTEPLGTHCRLWVNTLLWQPSVCRRAMHGSELVRSVFWKCPLHAVHDRCARSMGYIAGVSSGCVPSPGCSSSKRSQT